MNNFHYAGYYTEIMQILDFEEVRNEDDDQLFYTKVYLDEEYRLKYKIVLDHKSEIFQNLNGALCKFTLYKISVKCLSTIILGKWSFFRL